MAVKEAIAKAKDVSWSLLARVLLSERNTKRLEQFLDIQDPQKHVAEAIDMVHHGHTLVIVANHESHADILPLIVLSRQISQATGKNFLVPSAASLNTGHQGGAITSFFEQIEPWLESNGLQMVPFVRQRDVEQYGLGKEENGKSARRLIAARADGFNFAWFPEGSVQGGRRVDPKNPNSERFGIQEADPAFGKFISKIIDQGPTVFLPVGIHGSYKLLDPDTKKPTAAVMGALGLRTIGLGEISPVVSVKVGKPFLGTEIPQATGRKRDGADVGKRIMQKLSPLV